MSRRGILFVGMLVGVCVASICEADSLNYDQIRNRPPQGYSLVNTCEAGLGTVWAGMPPALPGGQPFLRQDLLGPKLSYQNGAIVAIEYQISVRDLSRSSPGFKQWSDLGLPAGMMVDHLDLLYSRGHAGFSEPHYDFRFYYVSHGEHQGYCVSKTSGQTPDQPSSEPLSPPSDQSPHQGKKKP